MRVITQKSELINATQSHTRKMEDETLLKNGGKKQRTSGGFIDDNRTTTETGGGGDRLSALPDTLLISILLILPIENAAATSVLSHRWRHLWTHHNNLTFNSDHFRPSGNFFATVDHILNQLNSPKKIKIFALHFKATEIKKTQVTRSFFDSWVPRICGRNVEEFEVRLHFGYNCLKLQLPNCIFQCQSLVRLVLRGGLYCKFPDNGVISLNNLKELQTFAVKMEDQLAKKLFKSCPKLESLILVLDTLEEDERENQIVVVYIFAPCLKAMCFSSLSQRFKFVIDAPNLEDMKMYGPNVSFCFVSSPVRLLNVELGSEFVGRRSNNQIPMLQFFRWISSVRTISLEGEISMFKALDGMENDGIFPNLVELSMFDIHESEMNSDAPIPAWLLGKLKKVQVKDLRGFDDGINFVGYILSHANALEELYVSILVGDLRKDEYESGQLWREYDFCRQLFTFPRRSPTCYIEFNGEYISGSSDDYIDGFLGSQVTLFKTQIVA